MAEKTMIRASHIIAYDGEGHRYLRDGVVVYAGNTIIHVGKEYPGQVDRTIEARGKVVTPGFINTHAHLAGSPLDKSFIEDKGPPQFYLSGLFEYLPARAGAMTEDEARACVDFSLVELLRSGTTTIMEMGGQGAYVAEQAGKLGLRAYIGQMYRSGRWYTPDGKRVLYDWDEEAGQQGLRRAVDFIEQFHGTYNDRIRGFLAPAQVDTCSEALLRETHRLADQLDLPVQIHVSQSVIEFQEMLRRHGKTPLAWLRDIGFLSPRVILGHAIIIGGSSWSCYPPGDLQIMAESGCAVAHAPWVFARRGIAMESFQRYLDAGITMTLGTDTCPQNIIQAMRWAAVLAKIVDRNTEIATARDVFNAATLGGARALGRDDLGRIAPGARADLLIFHGETLNMTPLRDPVKNIVYYAEMEDLDTVIIDGEVVVEQGRVLAADEKAVVHRLQQAGERIWPKMAAHDWANRAIDTLAPQSFPSWSGG
ncbi:MAG: amidohydrolase [Nitrospinota bacterium]|nr:MAG: amidohydrolase [Nitrospinota bacterium]